MPTPRFDRFIDGMIPDEDDNENSRDMAELEELARWDDDSNAQNWDREIPPWMEEEE